jgi:hypothetical protein
MVRRHGDNRRHHAQLSDRRKCLRGHRRTDLLGPFEQLGLVRQLPQDQRVVGQL